MRWLGLVFGFVAVCGALSGCAGKNAGPDSLAQGEQAAHDLDVAATTTTGVIRGVVVDTALHTLAGALVTLQGVETNTTSNDQGAFAFDGLDAGTYFFTAAKSGYTTVQQSVDVVAGVGDPEPVRILLAAVVPPTPFIEMLSAKIFLTGSVWVSGHGGVTVGNLIGDGNYVFAIDITPNGTIAQTEFVWDATQPSGAIGMAGGGTYAGDKALDVRGWNGGSPLVMRANATQGGMTADSVSYSFWAWPADPVPVGVQFNQPVDAFITVFHNFLPRDGWTFTADGAHPLPP